MIALCASFSELWLEVRLSAVISCPVCLFDTLWLLVTVSVVTVINACFARACRDTVKVLLAVDTNLITLLPLTPA